MFHSRQTQAMNSKTHPRIDPTLREFGCTMKTALPVGLSTRRTSGMTPSTISAHHSASVQRP
jgi:hypothetical protein